MVKDIPYRECCQCEYIEDCPHPTVDNEGHPATPTDCPRPEEIKLCMRPRQVLNGYV